MLTIKQIKQIREHLEKAQNPLFFFDNDPDGLCSFLLLQRSIGRGKGVPIKSFPDLHPDYFRKIQELNADYIFILDKPLVSRGFFEKVEEFNIPVVWIDHHFVDKNEIPLFVNYYNPLFNKNPSQEPVTYMSYKISQKKSDVWLGVMGCISDHFIPKFYKEFEKKYPELSISSKEPFDVRYKSQVGRMIRILSFALKDSTTNVVKMMKFLMHARNPYDILEENAQNYTLHLRYKQINLKYNALMKKAISLEKKSGKFLFFQYGGDLSISGDLADELNYRFPGKTVVVAYIRGIKANISMRGKKSREFFLKSIEGLEGATGGGHEEAVGGQMKIEDLEKFRENLDKLISDKI